MCESNWFDTEWIKINVQVVSGVNDKKYVVIVH